MIFLTIDIAGEANNFKIYNWFFEILTTYWLYKFEHGTTEIRKDRKGHNQEARFSTDGHNRKYYSIQKRMNGFKENQMKEM